MAELLGGEKQASQAFKDAFSDYGCCDVMVTPENVVFIFWNASEKPDTMFEYAHVDMVVPLDYLIDHGNYVCWQPRIDRGYPVMVFYRKG